jgi:hypothetical protein
MSLLSELSKKRKPAQEELALEELTIDGSTPVEYVEPVSMPDLEVDVNPNLPKDEIGRDLRSALVDAFVGGAPGLLSTLGGASPYVQNMQYDKGNQYAQKRSQEELNAKLVQLKSTDGTPYYEKARYAVGEEPYIVAKGRLGLDGDKSGIRKQFRDLKTDRVFLGRYIGDSLYDMTQGRMLAPEELASVMQYEPQKLKETEDIKGNKMINLYDTQKGGKKTIDAYQGLGSFYDVGTKGQAENIESAQKTAQKDTYEIERSLARLDEVEQTLSSTKDPRTMAASIYALARDYESKGILTDQDYKSILGIDMDTYLNRLQYAIDNRLTGQIQDYAKSFVNLARSAKSLKQRDLDAIRNTIPRGGPRTQAPKAEVVAPKGKPSRANQAKYIQLEKAAKQKIKDPALLKKFLERKKQELGL